MADTLTLVEDCPREAWNAFVEASPFGHFFQTWEWGDLQGDLGGAPTRITAMRDGQIVGAVQILIFETSGDRRFGYVPRGPVADPADDALSGALIQGALDLCARRGAFLLRFEPQWPATPETLAALGAQGLTLARQRIMPLRTVLVDLQRPLDAVWAGFHSNTRNRVRVAEKRGVSVRVARADEMESFVSLFEETGARHGLTKNDAAAARLAPKHFGERDAMRLFLASHEGVDIAGIVVFIASGWATYLWGGSSASEEARRVNPNQVLHWTAIQWAHGRGCTTYDLFGVPDYDVEVLEANYPTQTEGWWNLYKFKRGFGGTVFRHAGTFDCVLAKRSAAASTPTEG